MAIFDRIRWNRTTSRHEADAQPELEPIAAHLLPAINQRVTIAHAGDTPVSSRVEDVTRSSLHLAYPSLELELDDEVVVSWEREDIWYTLATRVHALDSHAVVPTMQVVAAGQLRRFDEQRVDVRRAVTLGIDLRVIRARAVRSGRDLRTTTTEVGAQELRFATTAPFAPGDVVEGRIELGEGDRDVVGARLRITRVDTVPGTWRSICTAVYDEVLRSDRARLVATAATVGMSIESMDAATVPLDVPAPTTDGVGGRDEPHSFGELEHVVSWLRQRG